MTYSDLTRRVEHKLKRIRRKQQLRAIVIMLAMMLVFYGILYVLGVYARPWFDKLDQAEASAVVSTITVTIKPKDTLWTIAAKRYPDKHTGEIVHEIRKLNPGINPGALQVGQAVLIPEVS